MRVLLVNPPSVHHDLSEIAPPLGLYSLAGVALRAGADVRVWDANVEATCRSTSRFYNEFDRLIDEFKPTVMGVTSMVVNTHIAAELARRTKARDRDAVTVAGGPHFGAFAHAARTLFPWIDYVVQGEGEAAFHALLANTARGSESLPGVLCAPVTVDYFDLTRPAFSLVPWRKYFETNPRRTADYESSRGCIYKCAFCYSPAQWGARPRYLPEETVIRDLLNLQTFGVRRAFFVDDNFLNDPLRAQRLCVRMIDNEVTLSWLCYATLNLLEPQLVGLMAAAGCDAVFVGVDAVGAGAQRELRKRFFRNREDALERLRNCIVAGITPTCALIVRREADENELNELVDFAAALRELGCAVRINPLIGYQGTPFEPQKGSAWYSQARVRLMLDDSPILRENTFAAAEPHLFPYHCSTRDPKEEEAHLRVVHVAATVTRYFPKTVRRLSERGESVWSRIHRIAVAAGRRWGTRLRRHERKLAMTILSQGLPSEDTVEVAREFATTLLSTRRDWIPVRFVDGGRRLRADVRPFVLDETATAPRLLVAAFGESVRSFQLHSHTDREELLAISVTLRAGRRQARQNLRVSKQTLAALQSADLVRMHPR